MFLVSFFILNHHKEIFAHIYKYLQIGEAAKLDMTFGGHTKPSRKAGFGQRCDAPKPDIRLLSDPDRGKVRSTAECTMQDIIIQLLEVCIINILTQRAIVQLQEPLKHFRLLQPLFFLFLIFFLIFQPPLCL